MTVLVFTMQVATPLKAATFFWGPSGSATNSGFWDTTSLNWGPSSPTGTTTWVNSTSNTAIFTDTANVKNALALVTITAPGELAATVGATAQAAIVAAAIQANPAVLPLLLPVVFT